MQKEGKGKGLRIAVALLALAIVVVLLMTPTVQNTIAELLLSPFDERVPKYATYRLERELRVDANGGTVYNFTLDAPVPQDLVVGAATLQTVRSVSSSPPGQEMVRYDVPWEQWQHGILEDDQEFAVTITYDVRVDTRVWDLGAESVGNVSDVPLAMRSTYLHDEWKIIISDTAVEQKAQEIVGAERNAFTVVKLIYDWVVQNVAYPSQNQPGDPSSSVQTLGTLVGDCDDQSILFCALARAAGVPAWLQLGALYDRSQDSWNGHGWVQAYLPLRQGGSETVTIDTVNRDFMVWMPNRLAEYTDDGNGQHLRDYYYSFSYTFDSHSYAPGEGPEYLEAYTSLEHEESGEKVTIGSILQAQRPVMGSATFRIWIRAL